MSSPSSISLYNLKPYCAQLINLTTLKNNLFHFTYLKKKCYLQIYKNNNALFD